MASTAWLLGAILGTVAVGVASAPVLVPWLISARRSGTRSIPTAPVLAASALQSYVGLAFVALVVNGTAQRVADLDLGTITRVVWWFVAWLIASTPVVMAMKSLLSDQPGSDPLANEFNRGSLAIASLVCAAGFWVFVFWRPALDTLWAWVPTW
ncbi:MAG: hypothetical protein AB7N73_15810 [Gemmatimonadales bacterium]